MRPSSPAEYGGHKVAKGKVLDYGTVRLLFVHVRETDDTLEGGLHWSPKLVRYSQLGNHTARIKDSQLEVLNSNNEVVETISGQEIFYVDHGGINVVTSSGFLSHEPVGTLLETALSEAELGRKPKLLDDSDFVKVDKKLVGEKLFVLQFCNWGTGHANEARVFTLDGRNEIECSVENPLAYSRWGERFVSSR